MQSDNQSGDDFAEECRRRVNEQGDDYAADVVLERGTHRALQTQQEDSDDDVAGIVRERAQFVADIVRERKSAARALKVQREHEQDEADRSGIDLEDKNEDFEHCRALQEPWALRVKREQEQDEADCSSIADGAASSSMEASIAPLHHGG